MVVINIHIVRSDTDILCFYKEILPYVHTMYINHCIFTQYGSNTYVTFVHAYGKISTHVGTLDLKFLILSRSDSLAPYF